MPQVATSYAGTPRVRFIPPPPPGKDGVSKITLNYQPFGDSYCADTNRLFIAAYGRPAVVSCQVESVIEGGLALIENWIRGAEGTNRLFIDRLPDRGGLGIGDENRIQTVNPTPSGRLWITRNGDRKVFVISPPEEEGGRWKFAVAIDFPDDVAEGTMIHSLLLRGLSIHTIESDGPCEQWTSNVYSLRIDNEGGHHIDRSGDQVSIAPFRYGIGTRPKDDRLWTVTDARSSEPHGIYVDDALAVSGVHGNGIAFLPDGSGIVTQYNEEQMKPGALVYIPAPTFDGK